MSGPDPHTVDPRAPGLLMLKPWALPARLRPATLQAAAVRRTQSYHRLARALRLVETHFPGQTAAYHDLAGVAGWWVVLAGLLNRVEAEDWFEVNWPALNQAWNYLQAKSQSDHGDRLATYLDYMPVRLYGFGPARSIHDFPPLELLRVLLHQDPEAVRTDLEAVIKLDLDHWTVEDRAAAWDRLYAIDTDPGRYPEPARWLPELARWACGATGNVILDQPFDPQRQGPWYAWDLATSFQIAWRRARPVIRQSERLLAWSQDTTNLITLTRFLAGQ